LLADLRKLKTSLTRARDKKTGTLVDFAPLKNFHGGKILTGKYTHISVGNLQMALKRGPKLV
jgi:hypothetical protein